jgi:hypothetical protein
MERFDKDGRLVVPDAEDVQRELSKHGVHYEGAVHVHQAFCPNGHLLITDDCARFGDLPGIKLLLSGGPGEDIVYVSPLLNQRQRQGGNAFKLGDRLEVRCPVCGVEMPVLAPCDCQWNGEYVMLGLDEESSTDNAVCFCNIWGCPNGDIRLAGTVISEYRSNYEL